MQTNHKSVILVLFLSTLFPSVHQGAACPGQGNCTDLNLQSLVKFGILDDWNTDRFFKSAQLFDGQSHFLSQFDRCCRRIDVERTCLTQDDRCKNTWSSFCDDKNCVLTPKLWTNDYNNFVNWIGKSFSNIGYWSNNSNKRFVRSPCLAFFYTHWNIHQ